MAETDPIAKRAARAILFAPLSLALALGRGYAGLLGLLSPWLGDAWRRRVRLAEHAWLQEQYYREATLQLHGDFESSPAAQALRQACTRALEGDNKLPASVRAIEGMSGQKYRCLINRLVEATPQARYLEVGSWGGSTACAAIHGNAVQALCIDNWSLFGGPKAAFERNIAACSSPTATVQLLERDFRQVDFAGLGAFNLYLFDGPHEEQDQYDGVVLALPALTPHFTLVVDDWNYEEVRRGTWRAIQDQGLVVEAYLEARSDQGQGHPLLHGRHSDWHNGYFVGVLRKAGA
jgi:hypothetical protein